MSSNLAISLVIGASIGGAIAGIRSLRNELSIFNDQTRSVTSRMGALSLNAIKGFASLGSLATGVGTSIVSMAQPAIKFESAMADVKKVVDFKTPEGFANLSKEILNLTRTLPMTAEELAAITASGGQLGVAEEDLKDFTTTIAKMSVAFDMSAEESGDAMAKLANVYKIPIKEIGNLGDAINELSNNSPAKASDIVKTLGRIGGVSKQFGLTENAAVALSNSFISLGKAPEVAGTAINGMLTKLMTADKGGKKFQAALKSMGLNAKDLKKAIEQDAQGALTSFLKQIQKLPKEKQMGALVDLFGLEYADDVAVLAGNVEVLENSLKMLQDTDANGKANYLGSMEKEFNARAATTENSLQLLKNSFTEIGITLGSSLLPIINNVVNTFKPFVHSFSDWVEKNPVYVEWGLQFGGVLFGIVGGLLALKSTFSLALAAILPFWSWGQRIVRLYRLIAPLLTTLSMLRLQGLATSVTVFAGKMVAMLKSIGSAFMWLGRVLMSNPIILVITAIAVAAYLIYDNWGTIAPWFANLWANITACFDSFCTWVQGIWDGALEWVSSAWSGITDFFSGLWDSITGFFNSGIGNITATILNWSPLGLFQQAFSTVLSWFGIDMPAKFTDFGKNIIDGLVNGIKNTWENVKQSVLDLGGNITSWFKEKLGIHSPSRVFKGYGVNVVEGLAIGMDNAQPLAAKASQNLSSAVKFEPVLNGVETAFKPLLNEKKGFFGTLWDDIKIGANFVGNLLGIHQPTDFRTPDFNPNAKISPNLSLQKRGTDSASIFSDYQPLNRNAVTHNETTQNAGGIVVNFNPTINVNGNNGTDMQSQIQQGLQFSLYELEKMMEHILDQKMRRAY